MRKRRLLAVIYILVVLLLAACQKEYSENTLNTFSHSQLSERERQLITATTDKAFVLDYHVDDHHKDVSVWIEKYKSGKFESKMNEITMESKGKGLIIFAVTEVNEQESFFKISVTDDSGAGSGSMIEKIAIDSAENVSSLWGSHTAVNQPIKGQLVLGSICYTADTTEMTSLTTDFYNDMDSHMDELKNYDIVYLLRAEFKK